MSPAMQVIRPAATALGLFILSLGLTVFAVVDLSQRRTAGREALLRAEGLLTSTRQEMRLTATDLALLEKRLARFRHLAAIGLVGDPDRDGWVNGLEAIARGLRLPPTLRYALSPPQTADATSAASAAGGPWPQTVLRHDLDIEITGIHEGEFLGLMEALKSQWQAPFRLEACTLGREADGLRVNCTLRLFSLPLAAGRGHREGER